MVVVFTNEANTVGVMQDTKPDGTVTIHLVTRKTASDVWSPPEQLIAR